jgi:Tfp pilus assembly protein PilO
MMQLTSQMKIILVLVGFAIFAILMFLFGYKIMAGRNQAIADTVAQRRLELEVLQREQVSFEQGKKDLARLADATYKPDELFSHDTKVVKEIQQLETAAHRYNVELDLQVSGTAATAKRVDGTSGELYVIPYTINLTGSFDNTALFMQVAERLPFITHAKELSITVGAKDEAKTVISSEFYIKK